MKFLNLHAIEQALREVQANFPAINAQLQVKRENMTDTLVDNLLSAYSYLDILVEHGDDLFAARELAHLLELNHRVLCGAAPGIRREFHAHIVATQEKFYSHIGWLKEWYQRHRNDPVYKRAAGVYVGILCQPQLFIEGNHRTGALIASLELLRAGKPPFVLDKNNALGYFNPSAVIKYSDRRKYWHNMFKISGIKKQFGQFLAENACYYYLHTQSSSPASAAAAWEGVNATAKSSELST